MGASELESNYMQMRVVSSGLCTKYLYIFKHQRAPHVTHMLTAPLMFKWTTYICTHISLPFSCRLFLEFFLVLQFSREVAFQLTCLRLQQAKVYEFSVFNNVCPILLKVSGTMNLSSLWQRVNGFGSIYKISVPARRSLPHTEFGQTLPQQKFLN